LAQSFSDSITHEGFQNEPRLDSFMEELIANSDVML